MRRWAHITDGGVSRKSVFDRLRDAIDAALDAATPPPSHREMASQMRDAIIEAKVSIRAMQDDLGKSERRLERERRALDDAVRRGKLAEGIDDDETARVAQEFADKHRERVEVLERKVNAQREELSLAERETSEMRDRLREVQQGRGQLPGQDDLTEAWREVEDAVGEGGLQDDVLRSEMNRSAREARAEEQLRELKRRMGK